MVTDLQTLAVISIIVVVALIVIWGYLLYHGLSVTEGDTEPDVETYEQPDADGVTRLTDPGIGSGDVDSPDDGERAGEVRDR